MNILIVGAGKTGARIANMLSRYGHDVVVVDRDASRFNRLDDEFKGFTVTGIPMDVDVLKNAGIESCDALIAMTDDDNLNITVSQIAKEFFKVQKIITRILDPAREDVFRKFGLDTICPTRLTASAVVDSLGAGRQEKTVNFGLNSVSFITREADKAWYGRQINEIPFKNGEVVFAVCSENKLEIADNPDYIVKKGDKIIISHVLE